jgi:hypothetical protein
MPKANFNGLQMTTQPFKTGLVSSERNKLRQKE